MRDFIGLVLRGFCMGSADLIPGVSGGTMAFILGIYERLMQAIKSVNGDAVYHFFTGKFRKVSQEVDFHTLGGIGLGIVLALFFFTRIIALPAWVNYYKAEFYGFFFGLMFATVILFLVQQRHNKLKSLIILLIGAAAGVGLTNMHLSAFPNTRPFIFLSGMIAITAMLLPGISGSYILLMLGKYELMLNALSTLNWPLIALFMGGCVLGVVISARAIAWVLKKYHNQTLMFITGLIAGTMPMLWPLPHLREHTTQALSNVGLCMLAGVVVIGALHLLRVRLSD